MKLQTFPVSKIDKCYILYYFSYKSSYYFVKKVLNEKYLIS